MEVLFAGICLWEKNSRTPALLGLMPNARTATSHGGHTIPPHTACVLVKTTEVDASGWPDAPRTVTLDGAPHFLFELGGDEISFDPAPSGGAVGIGSLPKLTCASGKVIRPSLTGNAPSSTALTARISIPAGARMSVVNNRHGAKVTSLMVVDGTELVSQSFGGGVRRLKFVGANPTVIVANID